MNILVTGGLGLIGHNVVKKLQDQGHVVSIMDTKTNYGIIPQLEIDYLIGHRIADLDLSGYYNYDITMPGFVDKVMSIEEPEIVIHMASFPRQKVVNANPALGSRVMSEGLLNLLESSDKYEVRKFIYISSSMVYGDFKDDVKEDYDCKPQGQYGILKLAGEWLVKDYSRRTNLSYTIIRPSAVYGPLDVEDRVISKFILRAMRGDPLRVNGAGETLDFTFVDDAADGIVAAALSDNTDNKTYNINCVCPPGSIPRRQNRKLKSFDFTFITKNILSLNTKNIFPFMQIGILFMVSVTPSCPACVFTAN